MSGYAYTAFFKKVLRSAIVQRCFTIDYNELLQAYSLQLYIYQQREEVMKTTTSAISELLLLANAVLPTEVALMKCHSPTA